MVCVKRLAASLILTSVLCLASAGTATADSDTLFGMRGGYYTKAEQPFFGGELILRMAPSVYLNPNVEYVFTDNSRYFTFNADFHYDFPSHGRAFVWAGAGLGVISIDPDGPAEPNRDVAANFLFGIGLSRGPVIPYFQAKIIAKEETEFSLGFGLRF